MDQPHDIVYLPQPVRDALTRRRRWPSRREFCSYYKRLRQPGNATYGYTALLNERPAERQIVQAFIDLSRERGVDVGPLPLVFGDPEVWMTFDGMIELVFGQLRERTNAWVDDPAAEMPTIARSILEHVGRLHADAVDDQSLLRRGEMIMNRTEAELSAWLTAVHARNDRAVMYALDGKGNRVSVIVSFATTREVAERICGGQMRDSDIRPEDVLPGGKHIFDFAIAPLAGETKATASVRAAAEIRRIFCQGGHITRHLKPFRPFVFCVGGSPLLVQRMCNQGFSMTGHNLMGSDKPMLVLRHRSESPTRLRHRQVVAHGLMCLGLRAFKVANGRQWQREDMLKPG